LGYSALVVPLCSDFSFLFFIHEFFKRETSHVVHHPVQKWQCERDLVLCFWLSFEKQLMLD